MYSLSQRNYFWKQLQHENAKAFSIEELDYIIDILRRYNAYVQEQICITLPEDTNQHASTHDLRLLGKFETRPSFYPSLQNWWRIWVKWGYQNISARLRSKCLINWESIWWIDITASSLQFLRILQQAVIPESNDALEFCDSEDPYDTLKNDIVEYSPNITLRREDIKWCIVRIISSWKKDDWETSEEQSEQRIKKVMWDNERAKTVHTYIMERIIPVIQSLEVHSWISIRWQVFKAEAEFLYALLEEIMKKNKVLLPIHDAFIMPLSFRDDVYDLIQWVSQSKYRRSLQVHEGF